MNPIIETQLAKLDEKFLDGKAQMFNAQVPVVWASKSEVQQFLKESMELLAESVREELIKELSEKRSKLEELGNEVEPDKQTLHFIPLAKAEVLGEIIKYLGVKQ